MKWPLSLETSEWVGYLGWCFSIYAAYLLGSTLLKGNRPKHAERWMKFVERLSRWRDRMREKGRAHGTAIAHSLALILLVMLLTAGWRMHSNVVTEHNVTVIGQLPNGDWHMSSDEEADLIFRPCPEDIANGIDVNGLFQEAIGFIADQATWQERGTCKSLAKKEWQFQFLNSHNGYQYRKAE